MFFAGGRAYLCLVLSFLGFRMFAADLTVRGRVIDEASAPVPGATISLRLSGQPSSTTPPTQAAADPTGAFQAIVPQPGSYLVTVGQPDFFPLTNLPVD